MKVKILEVFGHDYCNTCGGYYSVSDIIDWDEISSEEYTILTKWAADRNKRSSYGGQRYVIIRESDINVPRTIKEFLGRAKKELDEEAEKERNAQAAAAKRAETIAKKKEVKERKLLEELSSRYKND